MAAQIRGHIQRGWNWLILDDDYVTEDEEFVKVPMHTYQITYVNIAGVTVTELISATQALLEGELVELWDGDDLILAVSETAVQQIRNVSLLDMKEA